MLGILNAPAVDELAFLAVSHGSIERLKPAWTSRVACMSLSYDLGSSLEDPPDSQS